jgi:hypothetical protein
LIIVNNPSWDIQRAVANLRTTYSCLIASRDAPVIESLICPPLK